MNSLLNILEVLKKHPENICFIDEGNCISNVRLAEQIEQLAKPIRQHPAKKWALCYKNPYSFLIAFLATLHANKEPILLPNNQPGTIQVFLPEYEGVLSDLPTVASTPLAPDTIYQDASQTSLLANQIITLFTSGSTGAPKKVQRQLSQLQSEIETLEQIFGTEIAGSQVYSTVSHQHIYGLLFYLLWPLTAGRCIVSPLLVYPENIAAALAESGKMLLVSSPSLLKYISKTAMNRQQFTLFSSGSLLTEAHAQGLYRALNIHATEVHGSTETGGVAYRQQLVSPEWQPLPQVSIALDPNTSSLCVSSPFFEHDAPFMMGDTASIHADGRFQLQGRNDRIAKIQGKRVCLASIEQHLCNMDEVNEAYVLAMDACREYLATVIVLTVTGEDMLAKQGKRFLNQKIKTQLAQHFDGVLLPKKFRYLQQIPCNAQGKIIPDELKDLFINSREAR